MPIHLDISPGHSVYIRRAINLNNALVTNVLLTQKKSEHIFPRVLGLPLTVIQSTTVILYYLEGVGGGTRYTGNVLKIEKTATAQKNVILHSMF